MFLKSFFQPDLRFGLINLSKCEHIIIKGVEEGEELIKKCCLLAGFWVELLVTWEGIKRLSTRQKKPGSMKRLWVINLVKDLAI